MYTNIYIYIYIHYIYIYIYIHNIYIYIYTHLIYIYIKANAAAVAEPGLGVVGAARAERPREAERLEGPGCGG